MQGWKAILLRTIGWGNILAGSAGLLLVLWRIVQVVSRVVRYPTIVYFSYAFSLMSALTMGWLVCCLLSGIYFLRRDVRAYLLVRYLGIFQVCYTIAAFGLLPFGVQIQMAAILGLIYLSHLLVLSYGLLMWAVLAVFFRRSHFDERVRTNAKTVGGRETDAGLHSRRGFVFLVRALGGLNILFGFVGILLALADVGARVFRRVPSNQVSYSLGVFVTGSAVDLGLVSALLFAGYLLLRLDRRGVVISNYVFGGEVLFWLGAISSVYPNTFGILGVSPQIITGYPLIALVLLNWGRRHLDRCQGWKSSAAVRSPG